MQPPAPPVLPPPQFPQIPQALQAPEPPVQPVQLPGHLDQPIPTQQIQYMPQLYWSHFKPEFAGKPEEDAETHLLRTNDWMDTCAFPEGIKVQHFCLTLVGEARL